MHHACCHFNFPLYITLVLICPPPSDFLLLLHLLHFFYIHFILIDTICFILAAVRHLFTCILTLNLRRLSECSETEPLNSYPLLSFRLYAHGDKFLVSDIA
ncbi:hypothetical protein TRVL_09323 [Trypanosoma vivax]|nr:hypothetical protein TRVL_09323 [Trypanosoma vivax]